MKSSRAQEAAEHSRGTVYYHPEPIPEAQLALMRRIDELHLEHPFAGSRMLRDFLRDCSQTQDRSAAVVPISQSKPRQ